MLVCDPYGLPISIMDVDNAIVTRTAAGQIALRPRRNEHFGNGGYIYNKPATVILTILHEYLLDQRDTINLATRILPSVPIIKASRRFNCDVCELTCTKAYDLEKHNISCRHLRNVEEAKSGVVKD